MMNEPSATSPKEWQQSAANAKEDSISSIMDTAPFTCTAKWMYYLPITRRQMDIMGLVYSFQRAGGSYHMSHASAAEEVNMDRADVKKIMNALVEQGFLIKRSNGQRKPATYLINKVACWAAAKKNGYEPQNRLIS